MAPKIKPPYEDLHNKSMRTLVKEAHEKVADAGKPPEDTKPPETKPPETKPPESKPPETKPNEKPTLSVEDIKKNAREAVAEEVKKNTEELKAEIKKIQDSTQTNEEKNKQIEALKVKWQGVDPKTGKPSPVNYDEIVAETRRIVMEEVKQFYKEQKEHELEEMKKVQTEDEQKKVQEKKTYEERLTQVQARINNEMEELFVQGKLARPKDINDLKDPAARKVKDLFDQAAAYNMQRQKEGKELEPSIAKFFFMYYKPKGDQPAGADAPVSTNKAAPPPADTEDRYVYARDHRKSMRQILYEAAQRALGKKTP